MRLEDPEIAAAFARQLDVTTMQRAFDDMANERIVGPVLGHNSRYCARTRGSKSGSELVVSSSGPAVVPVRRSRSASRLVNAPMATTRSPISAAASWAMRCAGVVLSAASMCAASSCSSIRIIAATEQIKNKWSIARVAALTIALVWRDDIIMRRRWTATGRSQSRSSAHRANRTRRAYPRL